MNTNKHRVVYFNRGTKCIIRLLVSMFSLRKHYDGEVVLMQDGELQNWIRTIIESQFNVRIINIPSSTVKSSLFTKSVLWSYLPEDGYANLYLDSDTVVCKPLDELFSEINTHSLVFTRFCDWKTSGRKISGRINEWKPVIGIDEVRKAIEYGDAINTGVFGWVLNKKTRPFLEEWTSVCGAGDAHHCSPKVLDEIAAQVLLHKHPHHLADSKWNASIRFFTGDPAIIHFHGMKHVGDWSFCSKWKSLYWEFRNKNDHYDRLGNSMGDRRFKRYLSEVVKSNLTIVSSFDRKYYPGFLENFQKWMGVEGLREQKYLVFYNGFRRLAKETRPIRAYKNITFVPWELPCAESKREEMLSSFVLGVAAHIKTPYWMKLDGDCSPKKTTFKFPEYIKYTIVAHPWGYTKMKADDGAKKHWLNTLDDWWIKSVGKVSPLFDEQYSPQTQRRVSHSRFCSFCYFEKSEFTVRLAAMCNERLPIPSQDTLTWYVSTRWKEPVLLQNMKDQIRSA